MKKSIIGLGIVILVSVAFTTTMTVHTTNGDVDFDISEITSITFDNTGSVNFEMCSVPAGAYTYGDPPVTQNIDYDYEIMKFEVTNQQYVAYLEEELSTDNITVTTSNVTGHYEGDVYYNAGDYEFLDFNYSRIDWDGSNLSIISGYEDHPVVGVTWFGGWAFAEHYGMRLPTEEEWEKAARGNTGFDYPWGNNIDGSRANYSNSGDPWDNGTTPVGMYNGQITQGFSTTDSPSPFGVYDLAGNVWEWTDSWYNDTSSYRVGRGGNFSLNDYFLQSWYRTNGAATGCDSGIGFRCVLP